LFLIQNIVEDVVFTTRIVSSSYCNLALSIVFHRFFYMRVYGSICML